MKFSLYLLRLAILGSSVTVNGFFFHGMSGNGTSGGFGGGFKEKLCAMGKSQFCTPPPAIGPTTTTTLIPTGTDPNLSPNPTVTTPGAGLPTVTGTAGTTHTSPINTVTTPTGNLETITTTGESSSTESTTKANARSLTVTTSRPVEKESGSDKVEVLDGRVRRRRRYRRRRVNRTRRNRRARRNRQIRRRNRRARRNRNKRRRGIFRIVRRRG